MRRPGAALAANRWRNARGDRVRRRRWAPVREALWAVLDPLVAPGARVAVLGAGNGDTAPLRALAQRGELTLIDLDAAALERSRRHAGAARAVTHDVTEGAADAALAAEPLQPPRAAPAVTPLPGAPYDVLVGDLLYSQLLYPALLDAGTPARRRLQLRGPSLTRLVVARMQASARVVVHVHDALGWWAGHDQPFSLDDALADPELIARGQGPVESDPRHALAALGVPVAATHRWRWPFTEGVDYLAVCTVTGA